MKSKTKYLIPLIIIMVIMSMSVILIAANPTYTSTEDENGKGKLDNLKDGYNTSNPGTQLGKTIDMYGTGSDGKSDLDKYETLWCLQQGQSITDKDSNTSRRRYEIYAIINIGNHYMSADKGYANAEVYNSSGRKTNKSGYADAKLAYIIGQYENITKPSSPDSHTSYAPQDALWGYFDSWYENRKELLAPEEWTMDNSVKTNAGKQILEDAHIYAQFANIYDSKGKIDIADQYKEITAKKHTDGYYYAGPIKISYSYYKADAKDNDRTYYKELKGTSYERTKSEYGKLLTIQNGNNTNLKVTKTKGGSVVNIEDIPTDTEFYIRLSNVNNDINVTITQEEFDLYSTRMWFLKGTDDDDNEEEHNAQRLMVNKSYKSTVNGNDCKVTFTIKPNTDVSMQKYITKVEKANGTTVSYKDTSNNYTRANKYADTDANMDLTDSDNKNKFHGNRTYVSKGNAVTSAADKQYKVLHPVKIEVGDIVEYNITVYNNSEVSTKVKVRDGLWPVINGNATIVTPAGYNAGCQAISYLDGTEKTNEKITFSKVYNDNDEFQNYYDICINGENEFTLAGGARRTFKVQLKYTKYVASIQKNTAWISETSAYNEMGYRTYDRDYVQMDPTNISMQKYIRAVKAPNSNRSDIERYEDIDDDTRHNRYAQTDFDSRYKHANTNISKHNDPMEKKNNATTSYKQDNPVEIEAGEIVEYNITVYNNSQVAAAVVIKDNLAPLKNGYAQIVDEGEFGASWLKGVEQTGEKVTVVKSGNNYKICINGNDKIILNPGDYRTVKIRLKYIQYSASVQINTAWISGTYSPYISNAGITNDTSYRTIDSEYVKMKPYSVSLEKYVTEVTDKDGNNKEQYNAKSGKYQDRSAKRYNEFAVDKKNVENYNPYKYNNRVQVEPGDIVTFDIVLKNTEDTQVKVTQIYDVFTNIIEENHKYQGMKLTYLEMSGDSKPYIEQDDYLEEEWNDGNKCDRKLIGFENPILLGPDQETTIQVKFKVEIPENLTSSILPKEQDNFYSLYNKAVIVSLQNKYSIDVPDSDGADNNADMDFLENKIYKVSLEKYITKVEGSGPASGQTRNVSGRSGKRYNAYADDTTNEENYNKYKIKHPELVESGDYVTYKIDLKNESTETSVKITEIYDFFSNKGLEYDTNYEVQDEDGNKIGTATSDGNINPKGESDENVTRYLIKFNSPIVLAVNGETSIYVRFKVTSKETGNEYCNVAQIKELKNRNDYDVLDGDGTDNNTDEDRIKLKKYAVSLEKFVYSVNGKGITGREGEPIYKNGKNKENDTKLNNIVTVGKDDYVTYRIKVTNTGSGDEYADVKSLVVKDTILGRDGKGAGFSDKEWYWGEYNKKVNNNTLETTITDLPKGTDKSVYITLKVTEDNISLEELINQAEIKDNNIVNKNGVTEIKDTTLDDNLDKDFINMKDIVISGIVWNDKALNKTQDNYNGKYDDGQENKLGGKTVLLYRNSELVASTTTNNNKDSVDYGKYIFTTTDKGAIKASKQGSTNRWDSYYSYYIVFEYDGITYASTTLTDTNNLLGIRNDNYLDSNAREKINTEDFNGKVNKSRKTFNDSFSIINNDKGISYKTRNEKGYIPQSIHQYKQSTMSMQSSTQLIELANDVTLQQQIKFINLGLRGRDIFDLELSSVVDNIKVSVNGQQGVYNYNKVTLRKTDLTKNSTTDEDMANIVQEPSNAYVEEMKQSIRTSDLDKDKAKTNSESYTDSQLVNKIEVTYKITVHNASRTAGTATKITNYYDNYYSRNDDKRKVAYYYDNNEIKYLKVEDGESGTGYKSVVITTPGTVLNQSDKMEIYVVYTADVDDDLLKDLKALEDNETLPTYNMAEITEYRTFTTTYRDSTNNEATRGLLDKDSAPGSVDEEQVRTTDTEGQDTKTTKGNPTTLQYYFSKKANSSTDLTKLKYEDDTYATPTLYFVSDTNLRKISGTVFEDYTMLINNNGDDQSIRVKTGDGKQKGDEPGIKGVVVKLIENTENGPKTRYIKKTDKDGFFEFEGFLPGNYYIEYHYGNNTDTFTFDNNPNTKSYNGEDFQSTNNTGLIAGKPITEITNDPIELYALSNQEYWYAYNKSEGVSTAIEDEETRKEVSEKVTNFNDHQMTVLNNVRDGLNAEEATVKYEDEDGTNKEVKVNDIIPATQMFATTPKMELTVEETVTNNGSRAEQLDNFSEYNLSNMNFGIAEVPVTTIDLQKHVYSFKITDSIGKNTLAAMQKDLENTAVTVNPSKIAANRLETVINVLSDNLDGVNKEKVRSLINYEVNKNINQNISIKTGLKKAEIENIETAITMNSLAKEIKIVKAWKRTAGNVIAPPGTGIIDVSIENDKLQGAKLEVTYEITANISAEKNFNNDAVTVPSIKGIVDYIDNNLAYAQTTESKINEVGIVNSTNWSIAKQDEIRFGERGTIYESRFGTLDPDGKKFNTALLVNAGNEILRESCGKGTTYITLEKVLTSTDSTLDTIIEDADVYVYENSIEIMQLDYSNQGNSEDNFIYRDRVRTPDRYIILAGRQHDSAISETITIHPPTGNNNVNIVYYVIALVSLAILASGVFAIKKFVVKK